MDVKINKTPRKYHICILKLTTVLQELC